MAGTLEVTIVVDMSNKPTDATDLVSGAWAREEIARLRGALAGVEERWLSARERANHAEDEVERLRALIDKHNDECRECPAIES